MDWLHGMRAATAVGLPMLLGGLIHQPELAWCALGGFEAILADSGGPYRTRIRSLGLLTLGGAAGCLLGSLVGGHMDYALPVTLLWCFAWSYTLVLGSQFSSAAPLIQVIYFCGLGAPTSSLHEASVHAALLLAGGVWAMALSLFLWPVDAYRPARFAVADCYQQLASFLKSTQELNQRGRGRPALWHRLAREHQSRVRKQIEKARVAIASVRAGRTAESIRGRNLVVLLESADLLLANCVAISEYMEGIASEPASACIERGKDSLLALSEIHTWVADALRRRMPEIETESLLMLAGLSRIPPEMAECLAPGDSSGQFLHYLIQDVTLNLETAGECVVAVRTGREADATAGHRRWGRARSDSPAYLSGHATVSIFEPLRSNFHTDSVLLRHAARIAIVCGLDVFILYRFHINHGYWMPLTSLIVLQPHVGGTLRRSLQRMGGTIAGGVLAAILAVLLQSQVLVAIAVFPMALFAVALIPVSYALFTFFLTPTFVLVSLTHFGDWQLATTRIIDTIFGAVLAMAAMALLWPAWEHKRFRVHVAQSLRAQTRYLEALILAFQAGSGSRPGSRPPQKALIISRRAMGLAHNETEDSLDRLVLEPAIPGLASGSRPSARASEPAMAFVAYLRRVGQSITTLASLPPDDQWQQSAAVQTRLAVALAEMRGLEFAVLGYANKTASTLPAKTGSVQIPDLAARADPLHRGERQLTQLNRQIQVLKRLLHTMQDGGLFPRQGPTAAA